MLVSNLEYFYIYGNSQNSLKIKKRIKMDNIDEWVLSL